MKTTEPSSVRQPFTRCNLCNSFLSSAPVVLLACGSFNPVTIMHLRMMELARDEVERSSTLPKPTNWTKEGKRNTWCDSVGNTSSTDVSPFGLAWGQSVLCGVFSPVSDNYEKADLVSSSLRIELARLACQFHSDWLAVDAWEATRPEWTPTRSVADHLQSALDRVWRDLNSNEKPTDNSALFHTSPPHRSASNGHVSPHLKAEPAHDGLFSESWLRNCFEQIGQRTISGCPLCPKISSTRRSTQSISSSSSCVTADSISDTSLDSPRRCYPRPRVKLVFGADIIQSFEVPNLWAQKDLEHLLDQYGIVCISRSGYDVPKLICNSELLSRHEGNIILVKEWFENNLSSSLVRQSLRLGQSVLHLVPQAALEMIYALKLYGAQKRQRSFLQTNDQN